jgi:hypothetical protein
LQFPKDANQATPASLSPELPAVTAIICKINELRGKKKKRGHMMKIQYQYCF